MNNKCTSLGKIFTIFGIFVVSFLGATSVYGAKGFIIEESGGSKVLITDGYSEYIIEHDYDCYDSEFIEGATIYIDSSIYPMYGDTIIISGGFSNSTCEVTSSDEVNIKKYYVDKVLDSDDKIIVTDKSSTQYLVEYGLGCGLSFWRYEGKTIDIDVGGSFLDGIGDRIYLFNSDDDCKVWDAEEIGSNPSSYYAPSSPSTYTPPTSSYTCPINSHLSTTDKTKCDCNRGYQVNSIKDACIPVPIKTDQQICQDNFGLNVDFTGTKNTNGTLNCNCKTGYVWNSGKTACIIYTNPFPAGCSSSVGYSSTTGLSCDGKNKCSTGMQLNNDKTVCVSTPVPPKEVESKTKLSVEPIKTNTKKIETTKVDQKVEVVLPIKPEPVKKLKWYQKVFSWFK